ncbi:metalloendopeptidase, partial [Coemansia sp. RSA 2704]
METSLRAKLAPLGQQELVELQALKKEYVEAAGLPYEGFYKWDKEFFTNLQFEQKYQVKSELVKEYFPMIQVQQGILDIYQQMLGLKLVKVEHPEFAQHYQTGEVIPTDLVNKLIAAKNHGAGLKYLRQIALGTFDITMYNSLKPVNVCDLFNQLDQEIGLVGSGDAEVFGVATFGHVVSSYDSQYYGYLWSESIAADMFASRFLKDGIDSPQAGQDYRREILAPGGSRDAMDSIVKFLGRKPNNQAFLKSIGLG